jgi:PTS system beta-glucosides-specific IIC component
MADQNYEKLASQILELVGGRENISLLNFCMTRLRINVKDKTLVHLDDLKKLPGVVGAQWSGEQLQIIIGQTVEDVYSAVCKVGGFHENEQINEMIDEDKNLGKKKFSFKTWFQNIIAVIVACVEPVFVVFTVGGILKLLATLLGPTIFNVLPEDSDIIVLLNLTGQVCFTYLGVYVAYSSAKLFKANIPIALIIACLMLSPGFTSIVESGKVFSVWGIPMIHADYSNSFLPTIMITWVQSKIEAYFKKIFPVSVRGLLYPVCTMVLMLPIALCIIGPIGTILGEWIADAIIALQNGLGPLATGLVGGLFPLLIVTGMHHALNSAAWVQWVKVGYDSCIYAGSYFMDFQLMSLCFAALIKCKKPETKALAWSCIATEGLGGISEPTIYGFMLKNKRNILNVFLGGFAAGLYIGFTHTNCYVFAPCGFFSVLAYSGGSVSNFVNGCIACAIAFIIPFVLSLIFGVGIEEETVENK